MRVLIYSGYSDTNHQLAELVHPNWQQYARHHGYEVIVDKVPWEAWRLEGLKRIRQFLSVYGVVCCIGSDVLFMHHRKRLTDLAYWHGSESGAIAPLTIAKENIRWWPINNDVAIWTKRDSTLAILDRIIADAPTWLQYPWLWQNHIWNLMQTEHLFSAGVQVREAREMNSTHHDGLSKWQLGDFIIHFPDAPLSTKIQLVHAHLPLAGDGTYIPK